MIAPGYQSWKWTRQDWRVVVVRPDGTIDYRDRCGAASNRLPSGRLRLCLPRVVVATLAADPEGLAVLVAQARRKERAAPGARVPWHPWIRSLHAALDATGEDDDPRLGRHR